MVIRPGRFGPKSAWAVFIIGENLELYHVRGYITQFARSGTRAVMSSFEPLGGLTESHVTFAIGMSFGFSFTVFIGTLIHYNKIPNMSQMR